MANWTRKLDISNDWKQANDDESSIPALCKIIAEKLAILPNHLIDDIDMEKGELIEEFRMLATQKEATFGEFNSLFNDLYNWGDTSLDGEFNGDKVCWIKTF